MISKTIQRRLANTSGIDIDFPDLHPVLARILKARGLLTEPSLDHSLKSLLPFHGLKDIDRATARLVQALMHQERMLIIGDFDCDGATSTALAMRVLKQFGAHHVDYLVPNRFTYGYGLTPEIVALAAETKQPQLIITVDNGMASVEGVARARALGIDVLITDHHLPASITPEAVAIVNPNQHGDTFPSKSIAGVGVIFYTLLALRAALQETGWFTAQNIPMPNLAEHLDLVALGTVADVVALDQNNRILVHQGIQRIRSERCCPGIRALLDIAKRSLKTLVTSDLAFGVGPRLNAAGRLQDMTLGIQCLLADSLFTARKIAAELDTLNQERQGIESVMQAEALSLIEDLHFNENLPDALCLFEPSWHQGVMGLVASKVKERIHRPVIAFSEVENGLLKGSARSVPGVHIRDVLDEIATRHPELLTKFGGHAMAAGLTLQKNDLPQFQILFSEIVARHRNAKNVMAIVESDGELTAEHFNLELALLLQDWPWGQGFAEPTFDGVFLIREQYLLKDRHLKLKVSVPNAAAVFDAIYFNVSAEQLALFGAEQIRLAYRLDVNRYGKNVNVQLMVAHAEAI